jgi:D-glycero-D-manno-heptose 1,7-bisphosphate phosphatase
LNFVFLDRDGVINMDRPDYVKSWAEFEFLPGSLDALRLLNQQNWRVILITNQSVINRGLTDEKEVTRIHRKMIETVAGHGGRIEAVYYCPHHPEDGCRCRKPEAGLIRQAQADYGIDLSATPMVGDSLKDLECARRAGCGAAVLVRTGQGLKALRQCLEQHVEPDYVADDLLDAVKWLLSSKERFALSKKPAT